MIIVLYLKVDNVLMLLCVRFVEHCVPFELLTFLSTVCGILTDFYSLEANLTCSLLMYIHFICNKYENIHMYKLFIICVVYM